MRWRNVYRLASLKAAAADCFAAQASFGPDEAVAGLLAANELRALFLPLARTRGGSEAVATGEALDEDLLPWGATAVGHLEGGGLMGAGTRRRLPTAGPDSQGVASPPVGSQGIAPPTARSPGFFIELPCERSPVRGAP